MSREKREQFVGDIIVQMAIDYSHVSLLTDLDAARKLLTTHSETSLVASPRAKDIPTYEITFGEGASPSCKILSRQYVSEIDTSSNTEIKMYRVESSLAKAVDDSQFKGTITINII